MPRRKREFLPVLKKIPFLEVSEGGLHLQLFLPTFSQTMPVNELFLVQSSKYWGRNLHLRQKWGKWMEAQKEEDETAK